MRGIEPIGMKGALVGITLDVALPDPDSVVTTVSGAEVTVEEGDVNLEVLKSDLVDGALPEKLVATLG